MTQAIELGTRVIDIIGQTGTVTGTGQNIGTIRVKLDKGGFKDYEAVKKYLTALLVPPVKKGDSITIIGRRWFDRVNGNTYHACECLINGKQVATVEFAYGYDRAYEYSGFKKLAELGYLPDWTHDTVIWRYCEERGIAYHATHSDVNRKKDL